MPFPVVKAQDFYPVAEFNSENGFMVASADFQVGINPAIDTPTRAMLTTLVGVTLTEYRPFTELEASKQSSAFQLVDEGPEGQIGANFVTREAWLILRAFSHRKFPHMHPTAKSAKSRLLDGLNEFYQAQFTPQILMSEDQGLRRAK